jgi:cell division protein FtsQ
MREKKYKKSFKTARRKNLLKNRFFWFSSLFVSILAGSVYLLLFSSAFKITEIKIIGSREVKADDIRNIVLEDIRINQNIFLCDTGRGIKTILQNLPKIASVKINKILPTVISVEVEERKAIIFLEIENNYYLIDKEGILFEKLSVVPSGAVKIKKEIKGDSLEIGKKVIDTFIINDIISIENNFKNDINIGLDEITVVSENRIDVRTSEGWEAYFNPKDKIGEKLGELKTLLRGKIPSESRKNIKYIDLRFKKVYIYPSDYLSKNPVKK